MTVHHRCQFFPLELCYKTELGTVIGRNKDTRCIAICIAIRVFHIAIYRNTLFDVVSLHPYLIVSNLCLFQLILKILGNERRNRVLSGLYMGRSDTALLVRQAALHVWKVIVANTPRTLREILATLFELLLTCLASTSHDKRTVSAL